MSVSALVSLQKPAQKTFEESPAKTASINGPSSAAYSRSTISTAEATSFAPSPGLPPRAPMVTKPGTFYYDPSGKGEKLVKDGSLVKDPAAGAPNSKMPSQDVRNDFDFKAKEKEDQTVATQSSQGRRGKMKSSSRFTFDPNGKTRFTNEVYRS